MAILGLGAVSVRPPPTLLLWNASASSPIGLYRVLPGQALHVGDMVVAWPPRSVRRLAAVRDYLPERVPLVKRVAAVAGSRVCASGASLGIDSTLVVRRRRRDPRGRPMPFWSGCKMLVGGELLLLSAHVPNAFDGRYFGVTEPDEVIGKGTLLWPG